ncbi:MAG: aminotransferase class IV [Desulfarculaceae bacterium]|nr:aminotransferase class IV [Desulfarculaceae bacterium]MCF8072556.1 aminotransferase class IV [Desulfarculaceae bacterium]MCF8103459.1 aminotransferase class IV [Desulfarculaceae bacterium]MCF8117523.1 aminotransferase class IV [Desulfarculaceae bacterium]
MSKEHTPPKLNDIQAMERLKALPRPWASDYLAMYSNWLGGIVRDPWLMSVPIDDHLVHRGDGVFEATKCIDGRIYLLERHLERLEASASAIHLQPPLGCRELAELAAAVVRAGGQRDCMLRIFLSRGPGGFTTNPFECPAPGLYLMASRMHPMPEGAYEQGVNLGVSSVPAKSGFFAGVKSCNYLPNVLLKREAITRGWDFAVCLDPEGYLAEGSTENFGLVDQQGMLRLPPAMHILEGTTVKRAAELAGALVKAGELAGIERGDIKVEDLGAAKEVMLFGTTLDVLPVTRIDGAAVSGGAPGPVARELRRLIKQDIAENPAMSLAVWE